MRWGLSVRIAATLGTASFLLAACASGRAMPDPTNVNPSQPHPPGEPVYVNPGSGPVNALLGTAAGASAAAAQRKAGGCYATCPPGTVCNAATGLCDTLPCRDRCSAGQYCDTTGPFPRCIGEKVDLKLDNPRQQ